MFASEFAARLNAVKTAGGWQAKCPGHDDKNASLSINEGNDGRVLLKCHAGCGANDIVSVMGLKMSDLFNDTTKKAPTASLQPTTPKKIVATYPYCDADGKLLYEVVRYEPKSFSQRKPDGNGGWSWKIQGVERVLYRLPELLEAIKSNQRVFIVEGEKDAEALVKLGLCATCNSGGGGAGKWQDSFSESLRGADVVIIPDNDETGLKHGQSVAASLQGKAKSVRVIELKAKPSVTIKVKDAYDWISAGGTRDELEAIVTATPEWVPSTVSPGTTSTPENDPVTLDYGPALIGDDGKKSINQSHFAARYVHESGIIYDPSVARFYVYDDGTGLWQHQTNDKTTSNISHCFMKILTEYDSPELLSKRTSSVLTGLCGLAKGIAERRDVFNQRRDAIHVANGMLVLGSDGTTELKPFGREWYSRNRSEIAWEPGADCPRFKQELLLAAMDEDDARLIQRYVGQCLLGTNASQTFLVLRGTPGGGKSTLVNVIEGLIGNHNVSELRVAQLTERFELVRFIGRTLLTGKDVPGDFLNMKPVHVLKSLVGNDTLGGEVKNGNEAFNLKGCFNVIISTNTRLRVKLDSDTGAWRRRMLIVDYERASTAKPVKNFDDVLLRDEGPGILNWAIQGAIQLLQDLDKTGKFQMTEAQIRRVDDLLSESDSVRSFVKDCVVKEQGARITIHDLATAYRDFCEDRGWEPLRERRFESDVPEAMMEFHRLPKRTDIKGIEGKNVRGFMDARLKDTPTQPYEAYVEQKEIPLTYGTYASPEPLMYNQKGAEGTESNDVIHIRSSEQPYEAYVPGELCIEDLADKVAEECSPRATDIIP